MQSSELESGLPDEAEQECIVFFLLGGRRELNRTQRIYEEYLQVMGRASCGCTISMRSILTLSKMWDADAKFAKRVSSNTRKGKM